MVTGNYLYVDKTEIIYKLYSSGDRYHFLARPRRFGKSLLISTLKELFLGNKNLFKDLWISKINYAWIEHPVIHLDFSTLDIETSQELKISLSWTLEALGREHGIDVSAAPSPGLKLTMLVKKLAQKSKVVILIDEYDYPLLSNLENKTIVKAQQKLLKNFFSVVKGLDAYLNPIFITGVSKFSKTSIFSGMNNLNDISEKPIAASLMGYTDQELKSYFSSYMSNMADSDNVQFQNIYEEMKVRYNGYRFSSEETKVYNPFP